MLTLRRAAGFPDAIDQDRLVGLERALARNRTIQFPWSPVYDYLNQHNRSRTDLPITTMN